MVPAPWPIALDVNRLTMLQATCGSHTSLRLDYGADSSQTSLDE